MDVYSKSRSTGGPGKGDKRRPTDEKKFRENWNRIDWRKKTICPGCKNEIDPETCHCGESIPGNCDNHSPIPMGCNCFRDDFVPDTETNLP